MTLEEIKEQNLKDKQDNPIDTVDETPLAVQPQEYCTPQGWLEQDDAIISVSNT